MKRRSKIILAFFFILICSGSFGQMGQYSYKRSLAETHDQWHRIILPDDIFGKIAVDFSDIRIIGITKGNDTVAAPYILQIATEKITDSSVDFKLINQSKTDKGYYFTFELPAEKTINQIKLDFSQSNFDWRIKLEGSQNQQEWFTAIDDYRILSIKNELTNYQFTTLAFPQASYHYFRVLVNSNLKPGLLAAKISKEEITEGKYKTYTIKEIKASEEKQNHQTVIDIGLALPVPVCYLKVYVHDKIDYYRPITVKYLADSFKTEKGWMYKYNTVTSGMLNSIEKNEFKFNSTILKRLEFFIENQDNQQLKIDSFEIKGFEYTLMTRFTEPATYYLVYGNNKTSKPNYDIDHFTDKIPPTVTPLKLGKEQVIEKEPALHRAPLFQNKMWLWGIMTVIIIILGWFSVKMMRKV
jgi:Protein of unknown function (DUF3999)